MAYISDYRCCDKNIDPKTLFGKDTEKLFDACYKVMHDNLFPYEDCYHASKPSFFRMKKAGEVADIHEYREFLKKWYTEHPGEFDREQESKRQFEENYARQFRIIYGVAKRHHIHLVWDGENSTCCMPDCWEIYKKGECIGRINM